MTFWNAPELEPKRTYRFHLIIGGGSEELTHYMVKKASRPQFEITESEHKYLNHTFYYPGKMRWSEVTFTIVDAISPNSAGRLMTILEDSGYKVPKGDTRGIFDTQTVSKKKAREALGSVKIQQLYACPEEAGSRALEEWTLYNAWIKNVNFGELDYDSEDLMNIEVTLRFDYAAIEVFGNEDTVGGIIPSNANRT